MTGWADSDRRSRLPDNWAELVRAVKKRDEGRCKWILSSGKRCPRAGVDVDHRRRGDDHRMSNLALLCEHHHDRKTAWEAHEAKRTIKASRFRSPEGHPGAVR